MLLISRKCGGRIFRPPIDAYVFLLGEHLPLIAVQELAELFVVPCVPKQIDVPIVRQLIERENGHDVFALPVDVRARSFCVRRGGDEIVDHMPRIVYDGCLIFAVGDDEVIACHFPENRSIA